MKTIPIIVTTDGNGDHITPAASFPKNAIAVICDGVKYTVYEPEDTVPVLS